MTGWLKKLSAHGVETHHCPDCDAQVDAEHTACASCGYEIVEQSRFEDRRPPITPLG